eukprot:13461404-Heterocapsa_arctica.AAC.1
MVLTLAKKDKQGQHYFQKGNTTLRDRLGRYFTQIGRVPWIIGGDWNMEPGTCIIEGTNRAAAYIDPGAPTCHTGNTLDWYMVSGGLALSAETKVEGDIPIYAHYP